MRTELLCRRLDPRARLPTRANPTDSGLDVYALEDVVVRPGQTVRVRTGIAVQIAIAASSSHDVADTRGYGESWTLGLFVWDRSGLGSRGLRTGGGVVDNPYTGEVEIVVTNVGAVESVLGRFQTYDGTEYKYGDLEQTLRDCAHTFVAGDRVAQIIVQRIELPTVREVEAFAETTRGDRGWGSGGR